MTLENKSQFLRRPRRPKLEKILIQFSSSDESSSSDETDTPEYSQPSSAANRELASFASFKPPNSLQDELQPLPINAKSNKNLFIINEEGKLSDYRTVHNTTINEGYFTLTPEHFTKKPNNKIVRNRPKNTVSPLKSAVSQSVMSHKSDTVLSRQRSFVPPIRLISGPDPLPCRPPKFHQDDIEVKKSFYDTYSYDNTGIMPKYDEFDFCLNDFFCDDANQPARIQSAVDVKLISNRNYNKICTLLEAKLSELRIEEEVNGSQLHVQTLIPEIKTFENRKPKRQTAIEMANYFKNVLGKEGGLCGLGSADKTRLRLMEELSSVRSSKSRGRVSEVEEDVTPTQLAIVDCLLKNGLSLNLNAHFLEQMPDLNSLRKTLVELNISFNSFNEIPVELLSMYQLEVLKIRNNPIKHVTDKLSNLQNLKFLNMSYCQLNHMPLCVYELENLVHLDVSYNRIPIIDADIVKLPKLTSFNIEGNEIEYLPSCMLKLNRLKYINVKKNYLHPLIWQRLLVNQIPSLFAISASRVEEMYGENSNEFRNMEHRYNISTSEVQDKLRGIMTRCDCCDGKRFDEGLKMIRPCLKIFGVKYLPFMFHSCSPRCFNKFKTDLNV